MDELIDLIIVIFGLAMYLFIPYRTYKEMRDGNGFDGIGDALIFVGGTIAVIFFTGLFIGNDLTILLIIFLIITDILYINRKNKLTASLLPLSLSITAALIILAVTLLFINLFLTDDPGSVILPAEEWFFNTYYTYKNSILYNPLFIITIIFLSIAIQILLPENKIVSNTLDLISLFQLLNIAIFVLFSFTLLSYQPIEKIVEKKLNEKVKIYNTKLKEKQEILGKYLSIYYINKSIINSDNNDYFIKIVKNNNNIAKNHKEIEQTKISDAYIKAISLTTNKVEEVCELELHDNMSIEEIDTKIKKMDIEIIKLSDQYNELRKGTIKLLSGIATSITPEFNYFIKSYTDKIIEFYLERYFYNISNEYIIENKGEPFLVYCSRKEKTLKIMSTSELFKIQAETKDVEILTVRIYERNSYFEELKAHFERPINTYNDNFKNSYNKDRPLWKRMFREFAKHPKI